MTVSFYNLRTLHECNLIIGIHFLVLLRVCTLLQNSWEDRDAVPSTVGGYILTLIAEMLLLWHSLDFTLKSMANKLTPDRSVDRSFIVFTCAVPILNVLWHFTLPFFDITSRHWFWFFTLLLVSLRTNRETSHLVTMDGRSRFSATSYSLLQWMISGPIFMFLDCCKAITLMERACMEGKQQLEASLQHDMPDYHLHSNNSSVSLLEGHRQDNWHTVVPACNRIPKSTAAWVFLYMQLTVSRAVLFMGGGLMVVLMVMTLVVVAVPPEREADISKAPAWRIADAAVTTQTRLSKGLGNTETREGVFKTNDRVLTQGCLTPKPLMRRTSSHADDPKPLMRRTSSHADQQLFWPLESFGFPWFRDSGNVSWFIAFVRAVECIPIQAALIFGAHRFWLVCLPIASFYGIKCLLEGVQQDLAWSVKTVTSEEWLLVFVACLFLGRDSMHVNLVQILDTFINLRVSARLSEGPQPQTVESLVDNVRKLLKSTAPACEHAVKLASTDHASDLLPHPAPSFVSNCTDDYKGKLSEVRLLDFIGQGSYGKVFKGYWKGKIVATKLAVLSATAGIKRERIAIMEAAISTSLSHPHIVKTFGYSIKAIQPVVQHDSMDALSSSTISCTKPALSRAESESTSDMPGSPVGFQVQLILEYCDHGSLRKALDSGMFLYYTGKFNYTAILDVAIDIAEGMIYLHDMDIIHSDIKADNILLTSSVEEAGRSYIAKVSDFGLAFKLEGVFMHTNKVYQGTLTHMAPEIFQGGRVGKATDVYAFGILLWELYTARYPFYGIDRISLPYLVCSQCLRPKWPFNVHKRYAELAEQCWSENSDERPSFHSILSILTQMREVDKEIEDATQQNGLGLQVMWDSSGVINLMGGSEDLILRI